MKKVFDNSLEKVSGGMVHPIHKQSFEQAMEQYKKLEAWHADPQNKDKGYTLQTPEKYLELWKGYHSDEYEAHKAEIDALLPVASK